MKVITGTQLQKIQKLGTAIDAIEIVGTKVQKFQNLGTTGALLPRFLRLNQCGNNTCLFFPS